MTYKRFALQDSAENTLGVLVGDYLDHQGLVGNTYQEQEVHSVVDATPPGA
jgi:precorrin-6x reductase